MKGLKKIALATAVAIAPFAAQADLKALDDSSMGNVTGQAGVSIELETRVSIGQFVYTDEGSFTVNDIVLGGSGVAGGPGTNLLDQLRIDIDVEADGDAVIHVASLDGNPIDWGMTASSMELVAADGSESTTLVSNLSGWGNLGALDLRVDTATDTLNIVAAFNVVDMDFDVEFLGVGIQDMAIYGAGYLDAPSPATAFALANVNVYKGDGLGASTMVDVLRVDIADISMDMSIGAINIGGESIGSIAMKNLTISDTRLAVYGKAD